MIPGEYRLKAEPVIANANRRVIELDVVNSGDRPIQVGSHFHFFEANRELRFDRAQAFGMRLNIPVGHRRPLRGGRRQARRTNRNRRRKSGPRPQRAHRRPRDRRGKIRRAPARQGQRFFANVNFVRLTRPGRRTRRASLSLKIPRRQYAELYGPTTGDRVRLADTDLFIEIEKDLTTPATKPNSAAAKSFATAWASRSTARARRRRARSRHHQRRDRRSLPASSRPTSAFATAASSESARPAIPT